MEALNVSTATILGANLTNTTVAVSQRCNASATYWAACEGMFQATYYVLTPMYFIFAILGHFLCLHVCYKEAKKEGAYYYQIFGLVSEAIEALAISFHYSLVAFYGVLGAERTGAASDQFRSTYILVWFYAFFSPPLMQSLTTTTLLFAVCGSLDRVLAMARPFQYKNWNHKVLQVLCCVICVSVGFGVTVFDLFRKFVYVDARGLYKVGLNTWFMQSRWISFLNQLRNSVRIFGLLGLIACNLSLLYIFRIRVTTKSLAASDEKRQAKREAAEKTLAIITLYQSISNFLDMSITVTYFFMLYLPGFSNCLIFLMWPLMDFVCGVTSGFDFYVLLFMSKKFRQLVRSHMFKSKSNTVGLIAATATPDGNRSRINSVTQTAMQAAGDDMRLPDCQD